MAGTLIYSVGIYARLSVDSHGPKNESIETQVEIARAHMESQDDCVLYDVYSDLGKTGTNFDREGFNRLMADIRLRKVNCIIVKDLSRLGRNHIETGNYIQHIFPFFGVRFIAVSDRFDSLSGDGAELEVNLKNLVNEMYARDIAIKVKSSKKIQWENGSYTGGIPPYGYRAEWLDGKKCLFPAETAADIVREVYRLYDSGQNLREIAVWLYGEKIHRPTEYRRYGHIFRQPGEELFEWNIVSVKTLLTNPIYMGCLIQASTCGKAYQLRTKHDIEAEDWSVQENTHEALVSEELFFRIAERFVKQSVYCNKDGFSKKVPWEADIYAEILYCGNCGRSLSRSSYFKEFGSGDKIRRYGYFCDHASRRDGKHCEGCNITGDMLTQLVKTALKQEFFLTGMKPKKLVEHNRICAGKKQRELKASCDAIGNSIGQQTVKGSEQYLNYRNGRISKEDFLCWKEDNEKKVREMKALLERESSRLRDAEVIRGQQERFIRTLLRFDEKAELDRELISSLIREIKVYRDKRVEVAFRFTREYLSEGDISKRGVSKRDIPKRDIPKGDIPREDIPKKDISKKDIPKKDIPKKDIPKEDIPREDVSEEGAFRKDILWKDVRWSKEGDGDDKE